ncbi:DegT/DnrJ/EryC1/StrS family aminotransferase [Saccharophagus degradans]|uniref:DegT/DnrJ/EryC1/StrS family aminotransferase n=1 Tax=Saccharophagus degradans TaxID=86304 RepID=UPI0024780402|nr:DegT/DnrJ/EryC1/StrS family aminotransferase [Saccharophagus degradans]WGO98396.1 DegT/DnrJ/EryC1/StrS family aminotransferase [Saccharophagus degradans]
MILSDLPPVGGRVLWEGDKQEPPVFDGFDAFFVDSGTSALALAILVAKHNCAEVDLPEVILPAYGCPDLVAAVRFAGCLPVLVDICSPNDPSYCLETLAEAVSANTIAVVAVNFLGVRERLAAIRKLLPERCYLIEDNAQWYPELSQAVTLEADIAISSFGRGKPASMLGGGMLLVRKALAPIAQKLVAGLPKPTGGTKGQWLKTCVYNQLLRPYLYIWLSRNPLLNIGATHYSALEQISLLSDFDRSRVAASVGAYLATPQTTQKALDAVVGASSVYSSPAMGDESRRNRLLRYPLVAADKDTANDLYSRLHRKGLGVTKMYRQTLSSIEGVARDVKVFGGSSNAEAFANQFLTLPVHSGVGKGHVRKMLIELRK